MFASKYLIMATLCAATLASCAPDPNAPPNQNTTTGAVTGAILGGIIGGQGSGDNTAQVIGGALAGGLIGGAIGNNLDRQAAELRGSIGNSNIGVTNTGSALVVNLPQDILFATDSATLRPDLTRDLYAVANNLQRYPNSTVQVVGHTDNVGAAAYNQDLSERRAASVGAILRSGGVASNRVATYGRGEDQPIASNLSAEGRAQNRRVEIIIRPSN